MSVAAGSDRCMPPASSAWTCEHLHAFWSARPESLNDICTLYHFRELAQRGGTRKPVCAECRSQSGGLRACLQCVHVGCTRHGHLKKHQAETDHFLSVDLERWRYHCSRCSDYVYDWGLDAALQRRSVAYRLCTKAALTPPWSPSKEQKQMLRSSAAPVRDHSSVMGLRGMRNMGATCFMTVVLQCLVHNPFLRNYFISGLHVPCSPFQASRCLACHMDAVIRSMFSGDETPYSPHAFLYTIWTQFEHLAGYRQQDAHEFLVALLDGLHASLRAAASRDGVRSGGRTSSSKHSGKASPLGSSRANGNNGNNDRNTRPQGAPRNGCQCVVHRIFGGVVRSDVGCLNCGQTSVSREPIFYLCLDLWNRIKVEPPPSDATGDPTDKNAMRVVEPSNGGFNGKSNATASTPLTTPSPSPTKRSKSPRGSPKNARGGGKNPRGSPRGRSKKSKPVPYKYVRFHDVTESLGQYVARETLDQKERVYCSKCQNQQPCSKQVLLETLPPTLSLQLKRFYQVNGRWLKFEDFIRFPIDGLDLQPFMCPGTAAGAQLYDLGSVIVHKGNMKNGHYICYVRRQRQWYKCDDDSVTRVTSDEVRHCTAYLLFYIRRSIDTTGQR